ncbi:hypothetical protein AgCh_000081 [Apium graveolens]
MREPSLPVIANEKLLSWVGDEILPRDSAKLFKVVILFGKAFELFKLEGGESGYAANKSMQNSAFCNADGDFLLVPQQGNGPLRGYVAEIFGTHFQLPDLGPIGSNGLVGPRDFLVPTAWFEERICSGFTIIQKFGGSFLLQNKIFLHLTLLPGMYDLAKFCPYNTVLIDHGDPSINTEIFFHSADRFNEDSEHTDITND